MLIFNVVLGYQGLLFRDFLWFFFLSFFFSIRPTDPISGNAFDGKRRKKGDGLRFIENSLYSWWILPCLNKELFYSILFYSEYVHGFMLNKRCITPYKRYIVVLSFASQMEFWAIQSEKDFEREVTIVPHWLASLSRCVYCARRKHTNWAVYFCSTKDSILGHVDVSQELSIFHALVVQFHSVLSVSNLHHSFPSWWILVRFFGEGLLTSIYSSIPGPLRHSESFWRSRKHVCKSISGDLLLFRL